MTIRTSTFASESTSTRITQEHPGLYRYGNILAHGDVLIGPCRRKRWPRAVGSLVAAINVDPDELGAGASDRWLRGRVRLDMHPVQAYIGQRTATTTSSGSTNVADGGSPGRKRRRRTRFTPHCRATSPGPRPATIGTADTVPYMTTRPRRFSGRRIHHRPGPGQRDRRCRRRQVHDLLCAYRTTSSGRSRRRAPVRRKPSSLTDGPPTP